MEEEADVWEVSQDRQAVPSFDCEGDSWHGLCEGDWD
jgi:hypothetical protein